MVWYLIVLLCVSSIFGPVDQAAAATRRAPSATRQRAALAPSLETTVGLVPEPSSPVRVGRTSSATRQRPAAPRGFLGGLITVETHEEARAAIKAAEDARRAEEEKRLEAENAAAELARIAAEREAAAAAREYKVRCGDLFEKQEDLITFVTSGCFTHDQTREGLASLLIDAKRKPLLLYCEAELSKPRMTLRDEEIYRDTRAAEIESFCSVDVLRILDAVLLTEKDFCKFVEHNKPALALYCWKRLMRSTGGRYDMLTASDISAGSRCALRHESISLLTEKIILEPATLDRCHRIVKAPRLSKSSLLKLALDADKLIIVQDIVHSALSAGDTRVLGALKKEDTAVSTTLAAARHAHEDESTEASIFHYAARYCDVEMLSALIRVVQAHQYNPALNAIIADAARRRESIYKIEDSCKVIFPTDSLCIAAFFLLQRDHRGHTCLERAALNDSGRPFIEVFKHIILFLNALAATGGTRAHAISFHEHEYALDTAWIEYFKSYAQRIGLTMPARGHHFPQTLGMYYSIDCTQQEKELPADGSDLKPADVPQLFTLRSFDKILDTREISLARRIMLVEFFLSAAGAGLPWWAEQQRRDLEKRNNSFKPKKIWDADEDAPHVQSGMCAAIGQGAYAVASGVYWAVGTALSCCCRRG